jgi:thioesterase domain-containing protein
MSQAETAARRERLLARRAQLSEERRLQLEQRLLGDLPPAAGAAAPGLLVEITPLPPRPGGASTAAAAARRPLFCVHPAGGDVLCFVPLARWLGADQPCFGLRSHGLEAGEEPLRSIEEMASRYVAEVRQAQPVGPYLLAGWSFGGLAAFEMAQQLVAAGEQVALLAIVDTPPGLAGAAADGAGDLADGTGEPAGGAGEPADGAGQDLAPWLLAIADYVRGLWGRDLGLGAADLAGRDAESQLRLFVERARRAELLHHAGSLEQVRRLLAVFRANAGAYRAYRPRPYPGPIAVFRAAAAEQAAAPDLGWGRFAAAPVASREVPGDHLTLFAEPHVRSLADQLRAAIDGVPPSTGDTRR